MSTDRSHGAARDSNSAKLSARLSPRLLDRVSSAVEDGPYHSRSHLVRTALRLLLASPEAVRGRGPPETDGSSAPEGKSRAVAGESPAAAGDSPGPDGLAGPADLAGSEGLAGPDGLPAPDGVHLAALREDLAGPSRAAVTPSLAVEVADDRGGGDSVTHAFVYDLDRTARMATLRAYDSPSNLTHEQATSVGTLRALADAALGARNWQVRDEGF